MNCIHKLCKINETLQRVKYQLEVAISNDFSNLLIGDVIKLSQNLDDLVVRCVKCKIAHNLIDILDINNIAGRHSMFFYYSKEHLLVCLAQYLKQGIENNEFCPVFLQPDWCESLFKYLELINLPSKNIKHYPINEMLESFMNGGFTAFRKTVEDLAEWTKDEGFSGIRMIGQCSYAVQLASKSDFLKFEKAINDAFQGTTVAGLCVYDFYDFINTSAYIDDEILFDSFNTHTNIHFQSSFNI